MTSKERILAAVSHEEPDMVPVCPCYGFEWKEMLTLLRKNCEIEDRLNPVKVLDSIIYVNGCVPYNWTGAHNLLLDPTEFSWTKPDRVSVTLKSQRSKKRTILTRKFKTPEGLLTDKRMLFKQRGGGDENPAEYLVKAPEDLNKVKYLLPNFSSSALKDPTHPWQPRAEETRLAKEMFGDGGLVSVGIHGPVDKIGWGVYPITDMILDYYRRREFVEQLLRVFHDLMMAEIKFFMEAGADMIQAFYFWACTKTGWSPKIYRDLFFPLIKEQADLVHKYGGIYEIWDQTGYFMPVIDIWRDAGVDVASTMIPPPMGDVDIEEAKKHLDGKVCIKGYVESIHMLSFGNPEMIRKAVKKAIEASAPGGGLIISPNSSGAGGGTSSHDLRNEKVRAYVEAAREYGGYPIR